MLTICRRDWSPPPPCAAVRRRRVTFLLLLALALAAPLQLVASSAIIHAAASAPSRSPATVVVAGAGPASLLFSHAYLRSAPPGSRVHIYEKSTDPPTRYSEKRKAAGIEEDGGGGQLSYAFGFGLGDRAFSLLERCSPDLAERVRSVGAETPSGRLRMVNRRDMCAEMLDSLLDEFGGDARGRGAVEVTYGAHIERVNGDGTADVVVVADGTTAGEVRKVPFDLLVAGDGSNSSVRDDLVRRGFLRCRRYLRPVSWKALQLPSQPGLKPGSFLPFPLPPDGGAPEQFGALIPRHKDRFVLLTFWNRRRRGRFDQTNPWKASSVEELREGLRQAFPQVTRLPPDEVLARYLDRKPGRETYMKLNRHAVPSLRVALIGDAAVGMYSRMAQGCASAMDGAASLASEMSRVDLAAARENNSGGREADDALRSFSRESVRQGHAISDLNLMAHLEYNRWFSGFQADFGRLSVLLNTPSMSYSDILKEFRWKVMLSRVVWRMERLPMPSIK